LRAAAICTFVEPLNVTALAELEIVLEVLDESLDDA